ncbi:MAG TPA: hypothetical protein VGO86_05325 [Candidatus Dormibacteraeota bacterium]|jgi:hypothetical protein
MRLSLSVPDALWLRARESYPATPPSRLVQGALERLLADAETGYVPGPPPGAGERMQQLERRLRGEARQSFEDGYATGLELADVLEWWALERLAAADWRLETLTRAGPFNAVLDELRGRLADSHRPAAQRLAAELEPGSGDVRRSATFASGLLAALRDCAVDTALPY